MIQTWYDDIYDCTLHFDTSLIHLDLDSRSQECKKAKTSPPMTSQFSIDLNGMWYIVETYWCDQPRTHLYVISLKINLNIDLYSDIYSPISFKLSMMTEATEMYIFVLYLYVWMTLTILGHSRNLSIDLD